MKVRPAFAAVASYSRFPSLPGGIKFERPQIADGTEFDVRFELSTADSSIVLRTECFTVSVK
jgi:hypothetical protein